MTKPRILREGMKGPDVGRLQRALVAHGVYKFAVDQRFGPATAEAVKHFQVVSNLVADGVVGKATLRALGATREAAAVDHTARPSAGRLDTVPKILAHLSKGTAEFHEACYKILAFDAGKQKQIETAARRALKQKTALYLPLEQRRGIPWAMTAVIHQMECNNNPKGTLHNGQTIIGTTKKTTIVPKGRGPFATWLDGALDAVDNIAVWKVPNWSVGYILKQCERFNGLGYIRGAGSKEITPYVYACTNINDGHGKYVADGHFDPAAPTGNQVGCAALLRQFELWGEWKATYAADEPPHDPRVEAEGLT